MPTNKEFAIRMEDRPGTLGKVCRALADRGVNILAFRSYPSEGKGLVHIVVDNPTTAKTVLDNERLTYTQAEVAQTKLSHRPGELARAASRLGEANININHAYCGLGAGHECPSVDFQRYGHRSRRNHSGPNCWRCRRVKRIWISPTGRRGVPRAARRDSSSERRSGRRTSLAAAAPERLLTVGDLLSSEKVEFPRENAIFKKALKAEEGKAENGELPF